MAIDAEERPLASRGAEKWPSRADRRDQHNNARTYAVGQAIATHCVGNAWKQRKQPKAPDSFTPFNQP